MVVTTFFTPGNDKNVPTTGSRLRKTSTVGKKELKSTRNPYPSTHMPTKGHPRNTSATPPMNATVPFAFRLKNLNVLLGPMVRVTPERKRMFPIDSNPRSKNNMTPRSVKRIPKLVKPMPISARGRIEPCQVERVGEDNRGTA